MPKVYGRDLDLNLLRVFAVVAESGSVTEAANRLYMTQPAVSAALRRLAAATGRRCSCAADAGSPSPAVATIPEVVATQIRATRLHLKTRPLPFAIKGGHAELLWPSATDDDQPCDFVRGKIREIVRKIGRAPGGRGARVSP